jgi:hypothetical protein
MYFQTLVTNQREARSSIFRPWTEIDDYDYYYYRNHNHYYNYGTTAHYWALAAF